MNKKLGKNDMADSQSAIKDYISYREENGYRHKARVLISSNGKYRYNNILHISVAIDASNSSVFLEGDEEFIRDFRGTYGYEYQKFKFVKGILIIQATDIWGNAIEINITGE